MKLTPEYLWLVQLEEGEFVVKGLHENAKERGVDNDITYVHYPDPPHGFIQMTRHSARCLEATEEIAKLLVMR